jgi:glycerophosphoryl diester phosphodiesterase
MSYYSTGHLYALTKHEWEVFLNPIFISINDIIHNNKNTSTTMTWWSTQIDSRLQYNSIPWQWKRPNIILIFAESFSPEYSLHNGWLYDYMPHADQIQKDGITFTNYMAPGCVSEHAHTSLLQGIIPISYGDLFSQDGYTAFSADHDTLPSFFNKQNYNTTFISTAPLSFLNQREYLKKVWYQNIIGEEAFSWKQQRAFSAASDAELYKKTEELITKKTEKPYFLTLQTISSHQPRHSPYWNTVADTFRYTDDQLGNFYEQLKSKNFFDNGLLVIISDHRIRWKPQQDIINHIGSTRPSKVMATIVGTGIIANTYSDNLYQAIDFHFWFKQLISTWQVPILGFINNPFDTSIVTRDRWIHYCKYIDNTIWVIQEHKIIPQIESSQNIQKFIAHYQEDQFKKNILQQSGIQILSENNTFLSSWKEKSFLLLWHGGAPEYAPFDSLSGFITAIQQWADGVELDLSYTSDGVNIVRHGPHGHEPSDKVVNSCYWNTYIPTTDYYTLRNKCTLSNGEKILTFDELLNLTKNIIPLYMVEIKVYNTEKWPEQFRKALLIAKKHNVLNRIIRTSYDPVVRKIISIQAQWTKAWDMYTIDDLPLSSFMAIDYIMIPFAELKNKWILKKLKNTNKPIISYTPIKESDIKISYNMWLSGLLVDNIPLARKIINQIDNTK